MAEDITSFISRVLKRGEGRKPDEVFSVSVLIKAALGFGFGVLIMLFAALLQDREGFHEFYYRLSDKWIRFQYDENMSDFDAFEDVHDPEVVAGSEWLVLLHLRIGTAQEEKPRDYINARDIQ
jgi:hypothetical protein